MKPSYSHLMNGSSCEMSSNSNEWNVNSSIFSKIGTAMEIVRPMLPEDLEIETSYDMM